MKTRLLQALLALLLLAPSLAAHADEADLNTSTPQHLNISTLKQS